MSSNGTPSAADSAAWALMNKAMLTPEGIQDPYPLLEQLHDHGTHLTTPDGSIAVFGYHAVGRLVRSKAFRKKTNTVVQPLFSSETPEQLAELHRVADMEAPFLVVLNAPDHGRIRDVANRGFKPSHLAALKPLIARLIDRLLDAIDPVRPCDIIADFSSRFAPEVMAELIGLPADQRTSGPP